MKRNSISVEESFSEWKKDPEYVASYAALEEEFALASSFINASSEAPIKSANADHQHLLDLAALADPEEGIRQGLADMAAGRTRPAREVYAELRKKCGIEG